MSAPSAVLRVTTRLVAVDVVAADKRGQAVPDLIADNFTVLEDGRPQRLRVFSFQRSQAGTSTARHGVLSLPPNVFTNIPSYNTNTALNVILLDSLNATLSNQVYARQQTLRYLETIPEGQPVAVYTLGSKLRLAVDFTDDIHALKEAIKKAGVQESPFTAQPELDSSGRRLAPIQQLLDVWARENFSFQTDLRVRYTLDALKALARALSGYPGRKNLIWISETFPITIAPDVGTGLPNFEAARSYEPDVITTTEALGDAQVAVYPVDARGLVGSSVYDGASQRTPPGTTPKWWEDGASVLASHDTMQELAQLTGGKAYYNRGDLDEAIRNSIEDGSTYYTLAYYPDNKDWNGKFRKIQVQVNRPDIKLRYRPGYYAIDPKANKDLKERFASFGQALSLDFPISTGLRFEAGVAPPSAQSRKVMVNFAVDPHGISFEKHDDDSQYARIDCAVRAFTGKGQMLKTEASTISPALKPDAYAQLMNGLIYCHQAIELPDGDYLLRLGVLDQHSGLMGTADARVTVGPTSTGGR